MGPHISVCISSRTFSLLPSFYLIVLEVSFSLTQSTHISKSKKSRLTKISSLINLSILGLEMWHKRLCHNIEEVSMSLLRLEPTTVFTKRALKKK
jgi:hypothetical protein